MRMARSSVFMCLFFAAFVGEFCLGHEVEVTKCIDGPYHKQRPTAEGANYVECHPWKEKTCCTADFTAQLNKSNVEVLYNFSWHHCGNLSKECERYIKNEECFYSCEPSLIKWHTSKGGVKGVPICADYCDKWFDACKNDMTCAEDWLEDFNFTSSQYSCRSNSQCRKFSELYKDGKGLCNKMWGQSFTYEKSDNCMVMWFAGKNPNEKVKLSSLPFDPVTSETTKQTTKQTTSAAVTSYQAEFIITALALTMLSILPAVINTAYL
ncbi:riboflavin-binding protein-like isoform X2 [Stylophora pistillata]|uniref:Riboflavin-binding protein n=1 Tax=Stylophora pistillata TaxID=50429 RepID=A0A2B4SL49_STYPI|nr:riboflavin-binding protein-like isoform X2 [Stylophora pistillata]PFX29839.1 Riboflavin-binding protein [Stylophora pistillata]